MAEVSASDGWVFWSRVYEDSELRQTMSQKSMQTPTMAELLASPLLCKGELVFLNVPRLLPRQTAIIRQLINNTVRPNIAILDITVTNRRWILRFIRKEDAVEVMTKMDGIKYRGKALLVRINNNECNDKMPLPSAPSHTASSKLFEKLGIAHEDQIREPPRPIERDLIWSRPELLEIHAFKRELIDLLLRKEGAVCPLSYMEEMAKMRRKGLIVDALSVWPLGLIRMFAPEVRLTGRYISVLGRDDHAALLRRAADEGTLVPLEEWEAISSTNVRSDFQLTAYATALLAHFGPQNTTIDLPWRIMCHAVRGVWTMTPLELARFVVDRCPSMMLYDGVIYQIAQINHRRALLHAIQPTTPSAQ